MNGPKTAFALTVLLAAACESGSPLGLDLDADTERALRSITAGDLAAHVRVVADDSMAGRWTPGVGLDATGRHVREVLGGVGLVPAFDGAWEQEFEIFVPIAGTGINVAGILEGSDPVHRSEYVVVSAHMDHLGTGPEVLGDSIYNGADDNASGTAALLELAEALGELGTRPRRSILFAAFGGEEQGLLGSEWFVGFPPVPVQAVVANLNMDMVSRNAPDSIAVLRSSGRIGRLVDDVAARSAGLGLTVAPDPWPSQNLIRRSDQWSFIRAGVDGLLVTSGLHEDYHTRSDEADRIDSDKLERVTRLALLITLDLADPDRWSPRAP